MAEYLKKPQFLIKGMASELRSPIRREQLRKAQQLPGFKQPQGAGSAPPAKPRAERAPKK